MKKVVVLLSSYNGEKYIRPQVDSILAQQGVDVRILIRDDGSRDNTLTILQEYGERVEVLKGENVGCERSFYNLVKNAGGGITLPTQIKMTYGCLTN